MARTNRPDLSTLLMLGALAKGARGAKPWAPRVLLRQGGFRDQRDARVYWAHPEDSAYVVEVPYLDSRLDDPILEDNDIDWCYALDDRNLYAPVRCKFRHSNGATSFGVGCGVAVKEEVDSIRLDPARLAEVFGGDLGPAILQTVQVWSAPNLSKMRSAGVNHFVGIPRWGFWLGADSEQNAIAALVQGLVEEVKRVEDAQ